MGANRRAPKYRGTNRLGLERQRKNQPSPERSAQLGIRTWSPERKPMAAPIQWMAGRAAHFSLRQSPSRSWTPPPTPTMTCRGFLRSTNSTSGRSSIPPDGIARRQVTIVFVNRVSSRLEPREIPFHRGWRRHNPEGSAGRSELGPARGATTGGIRGRRRGGWCRASLGSRAAP